jgi:hypothetical protein
LEKESRFLPDHPGQISFYCMVPAASGMTGAATTLS